MVLPYTAWRTRRGISTRRVWDALSRVTTPVTTRLGMAGSDGSLVRCHLSFALSRRGLVGPLSLQGFDAGDQPPHPPDFAGRIEDLLLGLHPQAEQSLL